MSIFYLKIEEMHLYSINFYIWSAPEKQLETSVSFRCFQQGMTILKFFSIFLLI